jgi:superkiller protein 3
LDPTAIQSNKPEPLVVRVEHSFAGSVRSNRRAPLRIAGLAAATLLLLATALTAGAFWWKHKRAALREEVEANLAQATRLRESGEFRESRELLEQALARLGPNGPSDLFDQATVALADTRLVERLDTNRQRLFDEAEAGSPLDFAATEREYATALNEAVLVRDGEDKDTIAARVRNSSVRAEVLAAIQDWAAVTPDEGRRAWLLAVACAADPDPERHRLRRSELWRDHPALARLATEPVPNSLSAELALALERRAMVVNVREPTSMLVEVRKLYPKNFWLTLVAGWHLHHAQKWEEAIECHQTALAIRPRAPAAHYNLGRTLRAQGKLEEATEQFEEALRLDPKFASAHNGLGLVLDDKRKPDEAIKHYHEALRLNPKHATAQVNLGVRLAAKGQMDEAISNYEAALRINPSHAGAHLQLGIALRTKNKVDEAIGQFQDALRISPNYAQAHNELGNALHAKNQFDQAIPHYERAIQLQPANAVYQANLANTLRLRGRLDESILRFQEALRIEPNYAAAENGLGNALSDKGNPDDAIPHFEKAVQLAPTNVGFHTNFGNALHSLGRHDAAITQHQRALQIDAKSTMAQNGLGNAFYAKGKLDQAISSFEQAVQLDARNASALSNLGLARMYGKGQVAEAFDYFDRALKINPRNAVTQFNLGQALLAQSRFAEAREAVRRCLELLGPDQRYREIFLQTMRHLEGAERLPALEARLSAILQEKEKPANAAEALEFAWLCQVKMRFATAARLYAQSFAADPKPADELPAGHRFSAARCAALAAAGWGQDSPKPDDAERTRLRGQALEWLSADLAAWTKQIASANPDTLSLTRRTLALWLTDFRYFGVREKEELAKLPDPERTAWEKFWAETEALRTKSRAAK